MENEKRTMDTYVIEESLFIGDKEVLLGVDQSKELPYMVCYCDYNNPLSAPWPTEAIGTEDYLEAMEVFTDRVKAQIEQVRTEQKRFVFDMSPFTAEQCIPDNKSTSIVGKVVVMDTAQNRHEYQHSAYQLVLADSGNGALGGRGQAVFGTRLADGKQSRWERFDVLGEIKPEHLPDWAKKALTEIKKQAKSKKPQNREER